MPSSKNKWTLLLIVVTLAIVTTGFQLRWHFFKNAVNLFGFWAAIYIDIGLLSFWIALIVLARLTCGRRGYWLFVAAPWVLMGPFTDWYIFWCSAHGSCL